MVKLLLALLAVASLCIGAAACGEAHKGGNPAATKASVKTAAVDSGATTVQGRFKGDEDDDDEPSPSANAKNLNDEDSDFDNDQQDNVGKRYMDSDDNAVLRFGHAASPADRRTIVSTIKRYYAAAARGDGATACALSFSLFAEALPEDYGHAPGPLYARGSKTCTEVLTRVFAHLHARLIEPPTVTSVRIRLHQADAVVGSTTMPAGQIQLRSERGVWKISRVLSGPLP